MSRFDKNPFDEDESSSFPTSANRGRVAAPPVASGSFFDSAKTTPKSTSSLSSDPEIRRKEKELQAKEAELKRKEAELARREQAVGIAVKNFPPFFPIIRNAIREDIPDYLQYIMFAAYFAWLGIMICLLYNFAAVTVAWADGSMKGSSGFGNFIMSLLYFIVGVPGSYLLWYSRLYYSMSKDSAIWYALFFVGFLMHCAFVIFASVAPPIFFKGRSLTGVYATIELFSDSHTLSGIVFGIGSGLFICESILSLYVLGQVYAYFRGTGKANQMKREAAMSAIRNGSV